MRRQNIEQQVLAAFEAGITDPVAIAARVDISEGNVCNYLNRLNAKGKLVRLGRGRYQPSKCALSEVWR